MLSVFARTFMTATRLQGLEGDNRQQKTDAGPRSWLPEGHWWKEDTHKRPLQSR